MTKYKIGDFVECIDNSNVSEYLQIGEVYEIQYIVLGINNERFFHLKGINGPYALNSGRFILAVANTKIGELL